MALMIPSFCQTRNSAATGLGPQIPYGEQRAREKREWGLWGRLRRPHKPHTSPLSHARRITAHRSVAEHAGGFP